MPTPTRAKPPVPAWIIRERKRLGLKPRDLAERLTAAGLPVAEGTVRTWEAGRNPHPDNVEGLERIFGTRSPDYMDTSGQGATPGLDVSAYLARVDGLVGLVTDLVAQNALLMQTLGLDPLPPADVRETIREAQEQRRTASTLRPADGPRGTGTRSRARSAG